jgi:hypothetical protein
VTLDDLGVALADPTCLANLGLIGAEADVLVVSLADLRWIACALNDAALCGYLLQSRQLANSEFFAGQIRDEVGRAGRYILDGLRLRTLEHYALPSPGSVGVNRFAALEEDGNRIIRRRWRHPPLRLVPAIGGVAQLLGLLATHRPDRWLLASCLFGDLCASTEEELRDVEELSPRSGSPAVSAGLLRETDLELERLLSGDAGDTDRALPVAWHWPGEMTLFVLAIPSTGKPGYRVRKRLEQTVGRAYLGREWLAVAGLDATFENLVIVGEGMQRLYDRLTRPRPPPSTAATP